MNDFSNLLMIAESVVLIIAGSKLAFLTLFVGGVSQLCRNRSTEKAKKIAYDHFFQLDLQTKRFKEFEESLREMARDQGMKKYVTALHEELFEFLKDRYNSQVSQYQKLQSTQKDIESNKAELKKRTQELLQARGRLQEARKSFAQQQQIEQQNFKKEFEEQAKKFRKEIAKKEKDAEKRAEKNRRKDREHAGTQQELREELDLQKQENIDLISQVKKLKEDHSRIVQKLEEDMRLLMSNIDYNREIERRIEHLEWWEETLLEKNGELQDQVRELQALDASRKAVLEKASAQLELQ